MGAHASKTAIIQVACGFTRRPQHYDDYRAVSPIDAARAEAVRAQYQTGNQLWVTGMVPYGTDYPERTLANINADRLAVQHGLPTINAAQVPGLNAFSESWNACRLARKRRLTKIIVVASNFYFEAYARMWLAAGKRNGLEVEIVALDHGSAVSDSVWNFYRGPKAQALSHVAAGSTLGHYMASALADRMTAKRATEGFKIDGHTHIG